MDVKSKPEKVRELRILGAYKLEPGKAKSKRHLAASGRQLCVLTNVHVEHALERQVLTCTEGRQRNRNLTIEWPTSSICEFGSRCPSMVTVVGDGT
jgi:hypothetical protein